MDINYELYKVFYYVAKTLSFSEASKCLYISQSAVSQSVKVLEKKLGQTLFIRSTKRVQLTPEGDILFKHIEPAMNLIHKGETQLLEANTLNGGQLRIAASDTICRIREAHGLHQYSSSICRGDRRRPRGKDRRKTGGEIPCGSGKSGPDVELHGHVRRKPCVYRFCGRT